MSALEKLLESTHAIEIPPGSRHYNTNKCPICGGPPVSFCFCSENCMTCAKGHTWKYTKQTPESRLQAQLYG